MSTHVVQPHFPKDFIINLLFLWIAISCCCFLTFEGTDSVFSLHLCPGFVIVLITGPWMARMFAEILYFETQIEQ